MAPNQPNAVPENAGASNSAGNGQTDQLRAECEQLKQALRAVEAERDQLRRTLVAVEAERDDYRKAVYAWAEEQFSKEPFEFDEDKAVPIEKVLQQLDELEKE